MAVIDDTVVERLIIAALAALNSGVVAKFIMPGDAEPDEEANGGVRWAELVAIDLDGEDQQQNWTGAVGSSDFPAHATGTITVNLFVGPKLMKESAGAYPTLAAAVRATLENQTFNEAASGPHKVDVYRGKHSRDVKPQDQRAAASGVILFPFRVYRSAGSTLVTLP